MAEIDGIEQVELPQVLPAGRPSVWIPLPWRFPATLIIISLAIALMLFRGTVASAFLTWWTDQTYSHGILILPIVIALVYMRRKQLEQAHPAPAYWGVTLLALLGFAWLLGNIGEVFLVQQLAVVGILEALVLTVLGTGVVRVLLFPLAFMFFAVPFGDSVVAPLQDLTAWFATNALQWSGISVLLEGRTIFVPSGPWEVAEACSGARYLIVSVVLAPLFAAFMYRRWSRRVAFFGIAIIVAILANGLRAYAIIVLGELVSRSVAGGIAHTFYGWIIFAVVIAGLFAIGSRWREPMQSAWAVEKTALAAQKAGSAPTIGMAAAALLGVAVLLATVTAGSWLSRPAAVWGRTAITAPILAAPWTFSSRYDAGWLVLSMHAPAEVAQAYERGNERVYLYIADYGGQRLDTFNSGARILNSARWSPTKERMRPITVEGQQVAVREVVAQSVAGPIGGSRLMWTWYQVNSQFTGNPYRAKILKAKERLLGKTAASATIVIAADYQFDSSQAADTLQDFLAHSSLGATQAKK